MASTKENPDSVTTKKIKVENWSSFLLQKLYHCYTKQKYCDFTLKMVDGNLKVHSVVMNACSNYFIQINLANSSTVTLPPQLRKDLMEPIVNFIYSGVLLFKTDIQKDLIEASKILKIDILTKLIDTEDVVNDKNSTSKAIPFEDAHIKQRHFLSSGDSPAPASAPSSPATPLPGPSVIKSTPSSSSSGGKLMAIKKLPFWKKRSTTPGASSSFSSSSSGSQHDEEQDIKPSRFELPEDSCPNSAYFYVPNFENPLSYESECMVKPDGKILKRMTKATESVSESKKIKLIKSAVVDGGGDGSDNEILPDDDYEEYDQQFPSTSSGTVHTPPKPILKTDKFDSARKKSVRFSVGNSGPGEENLIHQEEPLASQDQTEQKVITRKIVTIKEEPDEPPAVVSSGDLQQRPATTSPRQSASQSPGGPNSIHLSLNNPNELASIDPNHAKIIEEVLQKYPDLVRGNRNFKLKVVNSDNQIINYIMNNKNKCLVNTMGGKRKNSGGGGGGQHAVTNSQSVTNGSVVKSHMPGGGLESQTPPSFDCKYCGPNLSEPLPDYRTWRRHMQDVHGEKFDVRVCEYCGLKLSKRNLYLYHLLRVHGVRSESMQFPECSYCSYIALTENLLYKHCKNVHNKLIGFVCSTCNTMFKTNDQLMTHIQFTEHGTEKKFHECKHCGKQFDRSVNLKAHLRANHNGEQDNSFSSAIPGSETTDSTQHQVVIKQEEQPASQTTSSQIVTRPDAREYDAYVNQQYIEVPVMQSNAYGTLVLPGGVTIVDTNSSRLGEETEQLMNTDSSLGVASATMEPNEAVLGTNECGQTVLILNGTQQYILEQQADGRLILPDILANNCVISYATEESPVGAAQGEYEIINVEQAQQEVMMNSQGMLVSHQSVGQAENESRSDPGGGGYGAHEGETILDSTPSNQMVLGSSHSTQASNAMVLGSNEYSMSDAMAQHGGSQAMIQTIVTPSSGSGSHEHVLSSVIQSTSSSDTALLTPISHSRDVPVHSLPPTRSTIHPLSANRRQASSQNEGTSQTIAPSPRSTSTAHRMDSSRLVTEQTRMEIDDGELSSATHSDALSRGDGEVLISGRQSDERRQAPAPTEVSGPGPDYNETSVEYTGAEYDEQDDSAYNQDEYDSEGGMVIDAGDPPPHGLHTGDDPLSPSERHLTIPDHAEDGTDSAGGGLLERPMSEETSETHLNSEPSGLASIPIVLSSTDGLGGSEVSLVPAESQDGSLLPQNRSATLSGLGQGTTTSSERGVGVREKIQQLEQEWGDNLDEEEEMEEEEGEEDQVGPTRGEI
ncbi:hypothetical protein WDU94_010402 [Cyamophila willieti]